MMTASTRAVSGDLKRRKPCGALRPLEEEPRECVLVEAAPREERAASARELFPRELASCDEPPRFCLAPGLLSRSSTEPMPFLTRRMNMRRRKGGK